MNEGGKYPQKLCCYVGVALKNYLVLSTESMMLNFIKSLQWLINIFNSVDKTKLSYIYPSLYIYIYIYI